MEERQVSIDGESHPLLVPFVIAHPEPVRAAGDIPAAGIAADRFLMRISLGYPSADAERALLLGQDRRSLLADMTPCLQGDGLLQLQQKAAALTVTGGSG
jgi:MoxR-like ATPase